MGKLKRIGALTTASLLLAASVAYSSAAAEEEEPSVPEAPQIVDPADDANHHSFLTGAGGGSVAGADVLAVWFTNDAERFNVHIQTSNGDRPESMTFDVQVDPGFGTHCLVLRAQTGGNFNEGNSTVTIRGDCGTAEAPGDFSETDGPDGSSILTASFPRDVDLNIFADGRELLSPSATVGWNLQEAGSRSFVIDDTELGDSYTIQSEPEPVESPQVDDDGDQGDDDSEKKKKNCKKKKNKNKKRCKKKN